MKKKVTFATAFVFLLRFSLTFFTACQSGFETQVVPTVSEVIAPLKNEFSFTVKKDGTFIVSNKNFYDSYPQFAKAITTISSKISQKANEEVTISFRADGSIKCSKPDIIDENIDASTFLMTEGNMRLFEGRLNIVFNESGLKSISKPEIFVMFPKIEEKYRALGKEIAYQLKSKKAKEITLSLTENGKIFIIVPNRAEMELPLENTPLARVEGGCTYSGFKACVGEYWWAPVLNIIACAIGCLIAEIFDLPF